MLKRFYGLLALINSTERVFHKSLFRFCIAYTILTFSIKEVMKMSILPHKVRLEKNVFKYGFKSVIIEETPQESK